MIKHYKLKEDITRDDLFKDGCEEGGSWIVEDGIYYISKPLVDEISLNIAFSDDLSKWNDFDNVLVLDEDFGQPYMPFYQYAKTRIEGGKPFMFLSRVITAYNKAMDSLPFLDELPQKKLIDFLS